MAKILVVDDDLDLCSAVEDCLLFYHHLVEMAHTGGDALERLRISEYDAVILDWDLPEMNGVEICRLIRSQGNNVPVLMLTGKSMSKDKLTGLDSGADDYITKPFDIEELAARVRSVLRRSSKQSSNILAVGDIELDPGKFHVTRGGAEVQLLPMEFAMLEFFMRHTGQVFSYETLLKRIYSSETESTTEAVKSCLKRLRRKIEPEGSAPVFENIHGVGYRMKSS